MPSISFHITRYRNEDSVIYSRLLFSRYYVPPQWIFLGGPLLRVFRKNNVEFCTRLYKRQDNSIVDYMIFRFHSRFQKGFQLAFISQGDWEKCSNFKELMYPKQNITKFSHHQLLPNLTCTRILLRKYTHA